MMRGGKGERCATRSASRQRPQQCYAQRRSLHLKGGMQGTKPSSLQTCCL